MHRHPSTDEPKHRRTVRALDEKGIRPALAADGRVRSMPWMHDCIVAEREQHASNRSDERGVIAAWKIGPADRSRKQRVADKQIHRRLAFLRSSETDASWTVTRRV